MEPRKPTITALHAENGFAIKIERPQAVLTRAFSIPYMAGKGALLGDSRFDRLLNVETIVPQAAFQERSRLVDWI